MQDLNCMPDLEMADLYVDWNLRDRKMQNL